MKKEKLIINGNAFYEIDLECFEKKKKDTKHFPDKKAGIHSSQHTQKRQPLLQPHPFPHPLFPHRHIRQMIQRIQLQELSPKRLFPLPQPQLLLHPHLSSPHPQFVAAKSLIVNPPGFVYTSYYAVKALCVTYNYLRRETIFIST